VAEEFERRSGVDRRKGGRPTLPEDQRCEVELRFQVPVALYDRLCRIAHRVADGRLHVVARKMLERESARTEALLHPVLPESIPPQPNPSAE
jgi:hypothetical protein